MHNFNLDSNFILDSRKTVLGYKAICMFEALNLLFGFHV